MLNSNTVDRILARPGSGPSALVTRLDDRFWLLLIAVVTAILCMPFARSIWWLTNEGVLLHGADRMLRGDRIYVDFFEFLPPGGFFLTTAWFSITGVSFLSARLLAILTIVGVACFTYLACRLASGKRPLSALITIMWVVMSQGSWTQVNHHWFTTLFSMTAAWAALASIEQPQRSLRWPLIAGLAAGMAGMVTSTRGALAALAAMTSFFNLPQNWREFLVYGLATALVPMGLILYLAAESSLVAAFDSVIMFTATRYAPIQGLPFGFGTSIQNYPFALLFPFAALLLLLVGARDWRACVHDRALRVCAAFGLAGFLGCFPRPDIAHIMFAAPLALPLLATCLVRLLQGWSSDNRGRLAAATIGLCIPCILVFMRMSYLMMLGEATPTPRGNVNFVRQGEALGLFKRIESTPKGDAYFFYPYMPMAPFLTGREHISRHDIFIPQYTTPAQYHDTCLAVMQRADWIVIDRYWTDPRTLKQVYPSMLDPQPRKTAEFEFALNKGFEFVALDGTFEMRRRRKDTTDFICVPPR